MKRNGFDNALYLKMQSEQIHKRIDRFGGKLYLEFGGKIFDDHHASRVLPGFEPDSKMRMLRELRDEAEVVMVISALDIERNKLRGDLDITYDMDVLRLIDAFRGFGLYVGSVVITHYCAQPAADAFRQKMRSLGLPVYLHYIIEGYPTDVSHIVSDEGFGRNEYIDTTRPLVVVTAPGPGSGKMATCLSQLYHEYKRGIQAGYAKFETFPIWNLPLRHPVNLAYEAATADLADVNMIDPFHLEAYGVTTVNYNRDVEIFPVLDATFRRILGESPYRSPTDMGVNMAGHCIVDNDAVCEAARQEIIRRYFASAGRNRRGLATKDEVYKLNLLMEQSGVTPLSRPVVSPARAKAEATHSPAVAIELHDGTLVTGKTSELMGACAACLLNALKAIAGIPDEIHLISPLVIEPIQRLKTVHLGSRNPRLHSDEVLLALCISANTNPWAELALSKLMELAGCEAHASVLLSAVDEATFRKLGLNLTCEPVYESNDRLFWH